ncbi:MAG: hypothetical protein ACE5KS_05350 [Woeseiaceae bacterium]
MKLRIRGDTLRLRLKQGEVAQVAEGKSIVETMHFPGSVLTYRLDVSENDAIEATYEGTNLLISLPAAKIAAWANTDEVSLTGEQAVSDDTSLKLLIEKDFSCLDPGHGREGEDDADTFPHPSAGAGCG